MIIPDPGFTVRVEIVNEDKNQSELNSAYLVDQI